MKNYIKDLAFETVLSLSEQVEIQIGRVASKTLVQNDAVSMTLFAFDKNKKIGTHESMGDAMVTVLEGTGCFTVSGKEHLVNAGETLVMPAQIPHSVFAKEAFKMILVVVFPPKGD